MLIEMYINDINAILLARVIYYNCYTNVKMMMMKISRIIMFHGKTNRRENVE